jgi:hypothetical protein
MRGVLYEAVEVHCLPVQTSPVYTIPVMGRKFSEVPRVLVVGHYCSLRTGMLLVQSQVLNINFESSMDLPITGIKNPLAESIESIYLIT